MVANPNNATVQARIPLALKQRVQQKCIEEGVKITTVIRYALETYAVHGSWWLEEEEEHD